jgi:hypothetical protein
MEHYTKAPQGKRFDMADVKAVFGEFGMFCNLSYAMMFYGYGIKPAALGVSQVSAAAIA